MKKLLTLSTFLLLSIMTFAQTLLNGIYYTFGNAGAIVVKGEKSYTGSVTIPEIVKGYSVTSIGSAAFSGCNRLTSVTIPNSVTSIGGTAFQNCSGLTSLTIPNSVTSIGYYAFNKCSGLTSIDIPNSVRSIGTFAFWRCSGLTSVTIGTGVTSIGSKAFEGCTGLTSVTIGSGMIGEYIFSGCSGLTSVTIGTGVTSIDQDAFNGCSGLTSVTWNAKKCTRSFDYDKSPFSGAKEQITEFNFGDEVETIQDYLCYGMTGLTSIEIPNSVTSIGQNAFSGCSGLTSVTWNAKKCTGFSYNDAPFYGIKTQITEFNFGDEVETIPDYLCYGMTGLTSIEIPNSVTSIGESAFHGCSDLTSITIGTGVTSMGWAAFRDCSGLTSITIPNSVTRIGSHAFDGCSGLTSVTIGTGVTSIGQNAFENCSGLTSITIPNSVTRIGWYAFKDCSGLTSITIPNSVTSIGKNAFENCSGLTSVTIPNSVTSIEEYAFNGCSGLTAIYSYIENPTSSTGADFDSSNYSNATLYVPFGTKDKYLATDGWKNFTNIVEMSIEPIEDDTVIEFDDKDYIVDNTPVDLNNTVINDMYISMDNKSDVNNPDGFYDSTDKCIVINKATSASAIETAVASDLGSSDFINNYTGIVIELNGKGSVKINAQTAGNNKLAVKIGSADAMTYTLASKGDVAINYDVTENTYVYIYAVDADNQQQSLSMEITDTSDNAVKVYSVTVTPDATAIETVTETDIPAAVFGKVYSIDGKQLAQPQKGLNILKMSDGTTRKVVK